MGRWDRWWHSHAASLSLLRLVFIIGNPPNAYHASITPSEKCNKRPPTHLLHVLGPLHHTTFVFLVANKNYAIFTHKQWHYTVHAMSNSLNLTLTPIRNIPLWTKCPRVLIQSTVPSQSSVQRITCHLSCHIIVILCHNTGQKLVSN